MSNAEDMERAVDMEIERLKDELREGGVVTRQEYLVEIGAIRAAARALLGRLPICQCDQEMPEGMHFSDCVANEEVCANEIKALEALL